MVHKNHAPIGFDGPTALPDNEEEQQQWQEANRAWWQDHPMRYDFTQRLGLGEFSKPYYLEIDRRFFTSAQQFMPWKKVPFDALINFDCLRDKDVLEIGVGCGSHAQLLAQHSRSFTGIDLTEYAVEATTRRMREFGLEASILRMNAEQLAFNDNSLDFIWTWGVIHHSPNTPRILKEMHRVLRPGGRAVVMVYHRSVWGYYFVGGVVLGLIKGELFRTRSLNATVQRSTDGALARYYSIAEWRKLVARDFKIHSIRIYGQKSELFPIPASRIKTLILRAVPNLLTRFLTNRCRLGSFLVCELEKPA